MSPDKLKRIGKIIVKSLFTLIVVGVVSVPFLTGSMKDFGHPLSHKEVTQFDTLVEQTFTETKTEIIDPPDLLQLIPEFVTTPEGGVSWDVFHETIEHEYQYEEDSDFIYMGVRPEFSENMKNMEGSVITMQGYMFPLEQSEKQTRFLLGPFPASCPYHYHVPPKLILEVQVKTPTTFSYDAINIKGKLELVPKDDEYNLFYRLKDAQIVP